MSLMVNVHEAKTHLSRLLEQDHAGQEIILAKAGPSAGSIATWAWVQKLSP